MSLDVYSCEVRKRVTRKKEKEFAFFFFSHDCNARENSHYEGITGMICMLVSAHELDMLRAIYWE